MTVEAAVRFAYDRVMDILRSGGLPTTLDAYGGAPDGAAIEAATKKVSSKEFTVEEYQQMVWACESEAFPGL